MKQIQLTKLREEKKFDDKGYVLIFINGNWIQEHRYNVSKYINRELTKEEIIHHINGIKNNNQVDNLVIFPNQKAHSRFHRQIRQFSYTNPRKLEINKLKEAMEQERSKNLIKQ